MTLFGLDKLTFTLAAGWVAAGFLSAPAGADVTITAQEVVAGAGLTPPPQAIRLFYKGADARLEVSGAPTLVQDGKGNTIYGLDTARKTYFVTVPTQEEPAPERSPGMDAPPNEEVKFDFKQAGRTMTFAGASAHRYVVTGTVNSARPQGRRTSYNPAQWTLSGEVWLSDMYRFPSKENTVFAAQLAAASSGPFQQPLADALDKHRGLPLLARITVTYVPASSAGKAINRYGGVVEGRRASTNPITTITTFTVKSLSDAPLSDTLFHAPLNYALVAAPLTPYVPGTPVSASAAP